MTRGTRTYCRAFDNGVVTTCFYVSGLSWLGFEHKMQIIVGDTFDLENFRPTVANKSELEVCLYFSQYINMCIIIFI